MSKQKKGPIGVLKVPQQKKALSAYGQHVVTCMTANAKVKSPNPPLLAITAACAALDVSQAAMPGNKAATAQRDADWLALLLLLRHELDYVSSVAEQQTNPADAAAVITGSGFSVRKDGTHNKDALAAKYGLASGDVKLEAKAVSPDASYYWQWSTDMVNWQSLPETKKASTTLSGLTPATKYYFRFRALTRKGMSDWSQIISLLVH
jgi:hypothetical protein